MAEPHSFEAVVDSLGKGLMSRYWGPMHRLVAENPQLISVVPGFLIRPDQVIFYLGRTHLGVEYIGPERLKELPKGGHEVQVQVFDYTSCDHDLMEEIIGFSLGPGIRFPLTPVSYDLVMPSSAGADELERLNWNWTAQEMMLAFGAGGLDLRQGQFTRLVNARFFDADEGGLKTRHIKWLDLMPCEFDDTGDEIDEFTIDMSSLIALAEVDPLHPYPMPPDFRYERLERVNRFLEILGDRTLDEPSITRALATPELRFILEMRFSAVSVHPELFCEWQSEKRPAIKPDFMVVGPDGYADIVEFKLPELKGNAVVGATNREAFSAAINSYIAQTRTYREYFEDPNNRRHVLELHGIQVLKPRRTLVIGRRWHLDSPEWRAIQADYTDLNIISYDDLVDGVVAQFYD